MLYGVENNIKLIWIWIKSHRKISLWAGFIFSLIFWNEPNFMGLLVAVPVKLYFFYFIYLIIKWLFGFQGIGKNNNSDDDGGELWSRSGTQGKIGKMRRGMRRARRMRR